MGGLSPHQAVHLPIWQELLIGVEMVYLRLSPVYWGCGIPEGDGAAVVVVPAFLGTDFYLTEFRLWLRRIGYKPYSSNIGLNADCPNLLSLRLTATIEKAHKITGRKVHLVGHSLGGVIARAAAAQMPDRVASVISMAAPLQGISCHPSILRAAEYVRSRILKRRGEGVLNSCYTAACTCNFIEALATEVPARVRQTAIYTKTDGIVDWRACMTGEPANDFEVSATHLGMAFNPLVYRLVATRLAESRLSRRASRDGTRARQSA
jgi:pimeloyl-ACP methyl ester carboxylesterase